MTRVAPTPALARLRGEFPPAEAARAVLHRGTCGNAALSAEGWDALRASLAGSSVVEGACDGACWAAPAITVQREGHQHRFANLEDGVPVSLIDCLAGRCDDEYAGRGVSGLLERIGRTDGSIGDAITHGAYAGLAHAVAAGRDRVRDALVNSSYGTRYPLPLEGPVIAIVAGEDHDGPAIARHLLEGDAHRVIEGALIAAVAAGAASVRIDLAGQRPATVEAFEAALRSAEATGIPDGRAFGGGGIDLTVEAAGTDAPALTIEAAAALASAFDQPPPPTRLIALTGAVPRPGVYETPLGGATTWSGILAMAGATPAFVPALRIGGTSLVERERFDEPVAASTLGVGDVEVEALPRDAEV